MIMYIVTNTIKVKSAFLPKMIAQFQSSHTNEKMTGVPGFLGFELMQREVEPEISELVVLSRWQSEADQRNWTKSQSFAQLHPKKNKQTTNVDSPVLGNVVARFTTI